MERPHYTPEDASFPEPLPVNFDNIPEKLRTVNNWVVWKYASVEGDIKKPPFSPTTGEYASVREPHTWGSFQNAQRAYVTGEFAGVGIVLTESLGIVGIDIDHCIRDGQLHPQAQQVITILDSYTETSPSGTGIRILVEGKLPGLRRRKGSIELYEDMRYLTLTGQRSTQTSPDIHPRHKELYGLYQRLFREVSGQQKKENTGGGVGEHSKASYGISRPDEAVLQKALLAKNGENFRRYYTGDPTLWEGGGAPHRSQSEADFTLVLMLLYWTNGDTAQVERLFRQSGLMREKWNRPLQGSETYGERLIKDAIRKGRY